MRGILSDPSYCEILTYFENYGYRRGAYSLIPKKIPTVLLVSLPIRKSDSNITFAVTSTKKYITNLILLLTYQPLVKRFFKQKKDSSNRKKILRKRFTYSHPGLLRSILQRPNFMYPKMKRCSFLLHPLADNPIQETKCIVQ